jgi:glycosyltransferase involved in cell wall biosynthesis
MTTDNPLVTIAIPTYNRANSYLKSTINSALDQTYPNLDILISDNCSTDSTESLVNSLDDTRIRYIRQKRNIGAINNFNYCVDKARGKYFLLLHDDDLIDPDFIEVCIQADSSEEEIGIICTGTRVIDDGGLILRETQNTSGGLPLNEFFINWFQSKIPLYLCSTLFNTKRLKELGGFHSKHNLYLDVVAECNLAARFGRVDVADVKASVRRHSLQLTNLAEIRAWCEDSLYLLEKICEFSPEHAEVLRSIGFDHFLKRNFNLIGRIKSPIKKLRGYLILFMTFGYPINFFINRLYIRLRARQTLILFLPN